MLGVEMVPPVQLSFHDHLCVYRMVPYLGPSEDGVDGDKRGGNASHV
jgi:hypothetical protein